MALISTSTFNPLLRYVNVRMQQGVPIVDADLNELDDIRKFELRAFLKWFVGDGVPDGNDGFRIVGKGLANEFTIEAGAPPAAGAASPADLALRNVGRIIADGLDVIIEADTTFTAQDLHEEKPGAAVLAARLGVPVITKLTPATVAEPVAVYVDVWEMLLTADDEPELVHAGLGAETCARVLRNWVIRVRPGTAAPRPGDGDFLPGHSYVLLATVFRRVGDARVAASDVVDRRHRRLRLPPATLVEDVLGTSTDDYRTGLRRPPISLRDAINALLRGELPAGPDLPVAPAATPNVKDEIGRAFLLDSGRGLVAGFSSDRTGTDQVFVTRMSLDPVASGFVAPTQVTSGVAHSRPHVTELPDGTLFVAYQTQSGLNDNIAFKRGELSALSAANEIPVAETPGIAETNPFVVTAGPRVTVFFHKSTPGDTPLKRWQFRRWSHPNASWIDTNAVELSQLDTMRRDFHAAPDSSGKIFAVFTTPNGIMATQFDPGTGTATDPFKLAEQTGSASEPPFALCTRGGDVWVFWQAGGISGRRFRNGAWETAVNNIGGTDNNDRRPCAVEDADGVIWLIWSRGTAGRGDLFAMRQDPAGHWGTPRQLATSGGDDTSPFVIAGRGTTVWVFWGSDREGSMKIYTKRFVTAL
ncbi:hypothetical protein ALI22I_01215 [Saccharothrix sp. ALI-22-I]|uniref:DUF6519 domain-containing protein n=1 Tax=Saccharothrix sp. ALI-22-I TaxID=1933778 RepID=UPI00097C9337|nr:DUF6519 domain-containing protein [Saccharothrix sp. ALI-22-I]ONI92923.1 hypothetical protein ALI22I_01215 [Saccharothrix sp. ALI-22-I]